MDGGPVYISLLQNPKLPQQAPLGWGSTPSDSVPKALPLKISSWSSLQNSVGPSPSQVPGIISASRPRDLSCTPIQPLSAGFQDNRWHLGAIPLGPARRRAARESLGVAGPSGAQSRPARRRPAPVPGSGGEGEREALTVGSLVCSTVSDPGSSSWW